MISKAPLLSISESKSKELVPLINGVNLHSLHNPRREAEVFASNHLAHLSRTPNALILGMGFSYHIEEIIKVIKLKHKSYRIAVIEAFPELVRLASSYKGGLPGVDVYTGKNVDQLWNNKQLGQFLLEKPVVIIHPASFEAGKHFYESFLKRRAPQQLGNWEAPVASFASYFNSHSNQSLADVLKLPDTNPATKWMRAFWECKHAE